MWTAYEDEFNTHSCSLVSDSRVMMMLAMGSVELIHIKLNREYQLAHWGLYFVNSNMIL